MPSMDKKHWPEHVEGSRALWQLGQRHLASARQQLDEGDEPAATAHAAIAQAAFAAASVTGMQRLVETKG